MRNQDQEGMTTMIINCYQPRIYLLKSLKSFLNDAPHYQRGFCSLHTFIQLLLVQNNVRNSKNEGQMLFSNNK